jgi:hypothetical protein
MVSSVPSNVSSLIVPVAVTVWLCPFLATLTVPVIEDVVAEEPVNVGALFVPAGV